MEARLTSPGNLDVINAVQLLHKAVHAGGVDPLVLELVHLRASQINGFDEKQLSAIILNIAITDFFNRINRAIREQAGKTW